MTDDTWALSPITALGGNGFVWAAVARNEHALAGTDDDYTVFTGELLRILREGVPGGPQMLSLRDLHAEIRHELSGRGLPTPSLEFLGTGPEEVLFGPNPAYSAHEADVPAIPEDQWDSAAAGLEAELRAEQVAAIQSWHGFDGAGPGARRAQKPLLNIRVLSAGHGGRSFRVSVSRRRHTTEVVLTEAAISAARNAAALQEQGTGAQAPATVPRMPLLKVLAWALSAKLLPYPSGAVYEPHDVGYGCLPDTRGGHGREVSRQFADSVVLDLLDKGRHVLLQGNAASGKTTIARDKAVHWVERHGGGVTWLNLTNPDCGAESVFVTLLAQADAERHLLVVDDLHAQAGVDGRHPVLDLVEPLNERLGLSLTVLATAWPQIVDVLDPQAYGLNPVMTNSIQVINNMLRAIPTEDRLAIGELAEGDIEVALVALEFFQTHHTVPDAHQVVEQLAAAVGADRLTGRHHQRLLYWFACLGALEIDIPRPHVANWRDPADQAAFQDLLDLQLIAPVDGSWSVGSSTRARLLMQYAITAWQSSTDPFQTPGRIAYDHLRRMSHRHVRNTLQRLRLLHPFDSDSLGDLFSSCLDLTDRLARLTKQDPTWGGNIMAAAFASIALAPMGREDAWQSAYNAAAQNLDSIDPELRFETVTHFRNDASSLFAQVQQQPIGSGIAAGMDGFWPTRGYTRRMQLATLIAAEAASGRWDKERMERLIRIARFGGRPGGALAPTDTPWVSAMLVSALVRLQGGTDEQTRKACVWLATPTQDDGCFDDGWRFVTEAGRRDPLDNSHLDAFATALCATALEDVSDIRPEALHVGIDVLREALPDLAAEGTEVTRSAVVAALLYTGDDWGALLPDLRALLTWAIDTTKAPGQETSQALNVAWAASLLLTAIPPIITRELESVVDVVLGSTAPIEPESDGTSD